jgi:hypothetical protein
MLCLALVLPAYAPPPLWWSENATRIVANPPVTPDNYGVANLGQLKAVAKPFYDRLREVGMNTNASLRANGYPASWPHDYPWDPTLPINQPTPPGATVDKTANLAPINLGQLKMAFSFDLAKDTDGDGLPDWWETKYGLNPNNPSDANATAAGGGMTNGQHYGQGSNPNQAPPPATITAAVPTLDQNADTLLYPADDSQLLIKNGDFSAPVLQTDPLKQWRTLDVNWDLFPGLPPADPQPHWTPVYGGLVELQKITTVGSSQYCELDADWDQPALEFRSHGIQQTVDLARRKYILIFDYRGRAVDAGSFVVKVKSQGSTSAVTLVTKNGASTTEWKRAIATFDITGGNPNVTNLPVTLMFDSTDESDGRGAYIDNVILLPFDIEGYKRGTINSPGAKVPKGAGEYGQETVMMENADSEDNATQPDYATNGPANSTDDDDLVKVVLRWPKDMKLNGAKLELKHIGMEVDPTKATDAEKYTETGQSRLNFYKPDGTRLTAADLVVDNLGIPGTSYLAQILNTGELTFFIEGAENFGFLGTSDAKMKLLGGAMLKYELTYNGTTTRSRLLVYRGGFVRFVQPAGVAGTNEPGTAGVFELWDGKGRVRHVFGGFTHEFQQDETDYGTRLAAWPARSGKMRDGSQGRPGGPYNKIEGNGHTPPGWWWQHERQPLTANQLSIWRVEDGESALKQGGYCRWIVDDAVDSIQRYTKPFRFRPNNAHDAQIGSPLPFEISYKFDLFPIGGTRFYGREGLQIHPDGEKNGTAGCIGIQNNIDTRQVAQVLRRYHGLKLKVQVQ